MNGRVPIDRVLFSSEALSYGVRCAECGEWQTACKCDRCLLCGEPYVWHGRDEASRTCFECRHGGDS